MIVMIVSADEALHRSLVESIPLAPCDSIVQASGMLSAIWYGKTLQPDLVVIDLWPIDCCCYQLAGILRHFCPNSALRSSDKSGKLQLLPYFPPYSSKAEALSADMPIVAAMPPKISCASWSAST